MEEQILLVDEDDNIVGYEEKLATHQKGLLHRCFSVFIFNSKGEFLIQQRAKEKYHSGGLWANSVCSHPRKDEDLELAVHRRLIEELDFDCDVKELFTFTYRTEFENGLMEHELDHLFIGLSDKTPKPDPSEIMDYKWISLEDLKSNIQTNPEQYASWFKIALEKMDYEKVLDILKKP